MGKRYYTLCVKEGGVWSPQFGDYEKAVVEQELEDQLANYHRKNLRIVTSAPYQVDINDAVAFLNK